MDEKKERKKKIKHDTLSVVGYCKTYYQIKFTCV